MIDEKLIEKAEVELQDCYKRLENIALFNQEKVLNAFIKNKIALRHFVGSSGYGYGDEGRDALNSVFADIFKAQDAICSPFLVSGTHALSLTLSAILRPNDKFISITGEPYDTLLDCIKKENVGSLKDFNIEYEFIPLKDLKIDFISLKNKLINNKYKMVYMQRSRGYEWRNALSINEIEQTVNFLRNDCKFDGIIMLDNCYGEFIDKREPLEVGVNIIAGSMIKNPGGGIAPTGGYIAGDKSLIELCRNRLTAPSIGGEVGSYLSGYQNFFQGLFIAPHIVMQAVKGALLFSYVLSELGYETLPKQKEIPNDIITTIKFGDKKKLIDFIQTIQNYSPVDSFVSLLPWDMPGYTDQVIMAAGCFVQGSSIELSADAPIKPPFIAYMQGGITYEHCKIALKNLKL